jgi:hypothetical protein
MKTITRSILVSLLLIIAAPAYSDIGPGPQAIQIFICEFNDDATSEQVLEMSAAWLKAARKAKGGENMKLVIRFPIAEGPAGEGDFRFVITTPTFAEWGAFTDAYEGSAVSKIDEQFNNLADCGKSTMWEGIIMK